MSRSGRKHERIHQCIRCAEYDEADKYCLSGCKDVYAPKRLRYCMGFVRKKEEP